MSVLTVAGLWNSGPQHWQTHWENRHADWRRVQQQTWENPDRESWVAGLEAAVAGCATPPVLATHSLACVLVSHWIAAHPHSKIAGAFLVAPSDVEAPSYPPGTSGFTPMPMNRLPFPSMVIASSNDEYVSLDRARAFAEAWGSEFVCIGDAGHINGASGHGPWPEGEQMLLDFIARVQAGRND
jgi:uncharacterized protein